MTDKTRLSAQFTTSELSLTAVGDAFSVADVGEQLAWVAAALRSSPYDQGAYCTAQITEFAPTDRSEARGSNVKSLICRMGFILEEADATGLSDTGNCWWGMFRNPVIVKDYPIPRRSQPGTGVEVSLDVLATLMNSRRVVEFSGVTFVKGFSAMLIAVGVVGNVILWHLLFNADGRYISYEDPRVPRPSKTQKLTEGLGIAALEGSRHIVGWCDKVKNNAGELCAAFNSRQIRILTNISGAPDANYSIDWSGFSMPNSKCAFDKISIRAGQFITVGGSCVLGIKDKPAHISFGGDDYLGMLLEISNRHFVFYDRDDRRAWLVDGASAILHLLRASIKHYQDDRRVSRFFCFNDNDIEEADASTAYTGSKAAFEVLLNANNQKLPLYPKQPEVWQVRKTRRGDMHAEDDKTVTKEKTIHFCLKDRVEQLCHVLGQIVAHQDDEHTPSGVAFRLRCTPRRQLEGFDFMDVATYQGTVWPKVATLHAAGAGWVDFTRALHAVTLFGSGFGELFRPVAESPCRSCLWGCPVPLGRDYLAVCGAELKDILRMKGSMRCNPWRLVRDIYWHTPDHSFEPCSGRCHERDRLQVLLPSTPRQLWKRELSSPLRLAVGGAVIFGHSSKFPLRWGAHGDPVEGDPEPSIEEAGGVFHDSGIGTSNGSTSGNNTLHTPLSNEGQATSVANENIASKEKTKSSFERARAKVKKLLYRMVGQDPTKSSSGSAGRPSGQ